MKWFLMLWATPVLLLSGWFGLSYYDINFGLFILSRDVHDLVFQIYGQILGIAPERVPALAAKAILVDTLIVLAIVAFGKRRPILAWCRRRFGKETGPQSEVEDIEESLSRAP